MFIYQLKLLALKPIKQRIVEIAALKIDSKKKLRILFNQYFNPQKKLGNLHLRILEEYNVEILFKKVLL